MKKEHIAVHLTETAKNNSFVDSKIYGGIKIAGTNNKFTRTNVYKFKKENPFWFWIGVIASIIGIITGILYFIDFIFN